MRAPSWLASAVVHLAALNLLALLTAGSTSKSGSHELLAVVETSSGAGEGIELPEMEAQAVPVVSAEIAADIVWDSPPVEVELADDQLLALASTGSSSSSAPRLLDELDLGDSLSSSAKARMQASKGAEFYGIPAQGDRFVFIVDSSRSMIGMRFEDAKRELIYAVRRLSPTQSFYVVFFDQGAKPMMLFGNVPTEPALVPATQQNLDRLEQWVATVPNGPWTNPLEAVKLAIKLKPDAIYLLSDGEFTDRGATQRYLTEHNLDKQKQPRIVVNTIGLDSHAGAGSLSRIAKLHGGTYRKVDARSGR